MMNHLDMDVEETRYIPRIKHKQANQYIAAIIVNIFTFAHGSMTGWPSPILPLLKSETPPNGIPTFSVDDITWAGSLLTLSSIITTPIFSYTLDKIGRKNTAYIMVTLCVTSWLLIIFADSALMIHIARFLGGLAGGGTRILCPTYVIDIAEDDIKGKLGSLFGTLFNAGCLFSYIIGSYTSYKMTGFLCLLIPVIFSVSLFFLPESPMYLLMKGNESEARKSMTWFRNRNVNEDEMSRLIVRANEALERKTFKISLTSLRKRSTFRALLIGIFLMLNIQFSGVVAILNYTVIIFKESGSSLSPNISTIIVGTLLTLGGYIATMLVERTGRRPLLIMSNIFIALTLGILGIYFYLKSINYDVAYLWWLPVTCLSVYILAIACGVQSLGYLILAEITSPEARGMISGICGFTICFAAFLVSKSFLHMASVLGMHGSYWLFATLCSLSAVIVFVAIPETRNRCLEDIMKQLNSDNYINSIIKGNKIYESVKLNTP